MGRVLSHPPGSRPFPQVTCRAPLRTSFLGKRSKTTHALTGVPTNGTSVKTSASWNPFAQNSNTAGIVGSQGRDDYEAEDVEYYFNYSEDQSSALPVCSLLYVSPLFPPRPPAVQFISFPTSTHPHLLVRSFSFFSCSRVLNPYCYLLFFSFLATNDMQVTAINACVVFIKLFFPFLSFVALRRASLPPVGILADEGSNDRMDALVASGKHPIDIILLFAAAEGDVPKIEEILEAGADPKVTDLDGNTPFDLAGKNNADKKEAVVAMLEAKM